MGVFGSVVVLVLSMVFAAAWLSLIKNSPLDPIPAAYPARLKEEGVFAHNTKLYEVEKIGVGLLPGPEDLAVDSKGRIYAGCSDGWIKRIDKDGQISNWSYVGGFPLGLVVGLHDEILVCNAYKGLLNVTEGKFQVLSTEAEGLKYKLIDGLDVANDGTIYFTDASHKFELAHVNLDFLECRPNGRLLKYDPATGEVTVLLRDLFFPNGVALSLKQDFLVFCETSKARCKRYWLAGDKKGSVGGFLDSLPGYPDNIRRNNKGKFYIALTSRRTWLVEDFILKYSLLQHIMTNPTLGVLFRAVSPKTSRILVVDEEGTPISVYEDPDGKVVLSITTGLEIGDYLYLGSLHDNFVSRLQLN